MADRSLFDASKLACKNKDKQKVREIAYVAGIEPKGILGTDFGWMADACGQLSTLYAPHEKFDVERAMDKFQELLPNKGKPKVGNEWSYAGFVEAGIFGLIFILERNSNACAVLNDIDDDKPDSLDWYNIGLVWRDKELAGGTDEFIAKMRQCRTRFVIIILTLWTGVRVLHAHILLYDTLNNVAERFDPNHDGIGNEDLLANVDAELERFFRRAYPQFSRLVRPPKKDLFKGIQTLQEGERDKRKFDPPGYCQPFTFLYCECRLTSPDMDVLQVRNAMWEEAQRRSQTIGDFIRTYAECLQDNTLKLFFKYTKMQNIDVNRARQLKDKRVPMLKIAIRVLRELNAVGYAKAPEDTQALNALFTDLKI